MALSAFQVLFRHQNRNFRQQTDMTPDSLTVHMFLGGTMSNPTMPGYLPQPPAKLQQSRGRKALKIGAWIVGGLIIFGIGAAAGAGGGDDSSDPKAKPAPTVTVTAKPAKPVAAKAKPAPTVTVKTTTTVTAKPKPPKPKQAAATIGEGTYVIGSDIKPGTYKTSGASDSSFPNCYWARLKGTSGDFGDIIANGNPKGQTTITISSSDKAFETEGCNDWQKIG